MVWLLDGLFQFKGFMYTHGIVSEVFAPAAEGQPGFIGGPMTTFANFYGHDLTLWNTLSGEIQVAIGLGLILSKKTVKPALLASFGWALVVWWFGEGFGGLTSNTLPSPLMGAPGAVILYAIIGLLVYPTSKPEGRSPAERGPLGDRGGLYAWSGMWVLSAGLWLVNVNRASGATHEMIKGMAEASPHWLAKFQNSIGGHTQGHGTTIAVVLAIISVAVALGVWTPLRWPALAIGIVALARLLGARAGHGRSILGRRRDGLQLRAAVRAARPCAATAAACERRRHGTIPGAGDPAARATGRTPLNDADGTQKGQPRRFKQGRDSNAKAAERRRDWQADSAGLRSAYCSRSWRWP